MEKVRFMMTEKECINQLTMIQSNDKEANRELSDEIICQFLNDHGFEKIVDAWDNVPIW